MTWFFLLIVFGVNGVAFEHHPVTSQAKCVGLEPQARAAWLAGTHSVRGLGEIKGFTAICTKVPEGVTMEQFVAKAIRQRPVVTTHRPTEIPGPPNDGSFLQTFPLDQVLMAGH